MKSEKSLRHFCGPRYWATWFFVACFWLVSKLPLPVIWLVSWFVGQIFYLLVPGRRRVVYQNIRHCFPHKSEDQINSLVRKSYHSMAQGIFDTAISWWASKRRLNNLVQFKDRHLYDEALSSGRPIILLMAHFNAVEAGGLALSEERPLTDIYKIPKDPLIRQLTLRGLNRSGQFNLVSNREGLRPVIRALKEGKHLCYLADQDAGNSNASFVPFFGIEASTYNLLGRLASITNAIVLPCFTIQRPYGLGYETIFKPAFENYPQGNAYLDTLQMNLEIEKMVIEHPAQYLWIHKRFKTRPQHELLSYRDPIYSKLDLQLKGTAIKESGVI